MKLFKGFILGLSCLLIGTPVNAIDIKLSQLPLSSAASTSVNDSFPFVNSTAGATQRLKLSDIINLPSMTSSFAPINDPVFTGVVTAPTIKVTGLTASEAVFTDASKNLTSNAITGTGNVVMSASPSLTGSTQMTNSGLALGFVGPTVNNVYQSFTNNGGTAYFGLESSSGGSIVTGAPTYALSLTAPSSRSLVIGYSGGTGIALSVSSSGVLNAPLLTASLPVLTDSSKNLVSGAVSLSGAQVTGSLPNARLATMSNNTVKGNISGITATPTDITLGDLTDAGTDGIVVTGGSSSMVSSVSFAQHVSDTTHNGYLSSTDWNTFNGKGGPVSFTAVGSSPNSNGASVSSNVITLQPANGSNPGLLTSSSQTIGGDKTFSGNLTGASLAIGGALNAGQLDITASAPELRFDSSNAAADGGYIASYGSLGGLNGYLTLGHVFGVAGSVGQVALATSGSTSLILGTNSTVALTIDSSQGATFPGLITNTALTASQAVVTDGSKNLVSLAYTTANTPSTLVQRDGSGNFSASTITASLTGHSSLDVATSSLGNLTDAGTDGIVVTGGTGAIVGTTSLAQHVSDTTHNGYLSSTDWNTFNGKGGTVSFNSVGSSPNSAGASVSSNTITLQPADGSNPGSITAGTQTIGGNKQFNGDLVLGGKLNLSPIANSTTTGSNARLPVALQNNITLTNASLASIGSANIGSTIGGDTYTFTNATGANISIINNYVSAAGGEAIFTPSGADAVIENNGTFILQYNTTLTAWTMIGAPSFASANTANTGVVRNASGNFSAGTITASLSGNASTVTTNANLTGVITSVGNATSIASQTGTGTKFVVDTNPTLVTPVLGVATATSLAMNNTSAQETIGAALDTTAKLLISGTDVALSNTDQYGVRISPTFNNSATGSLRGVSSVLTQAPSITTTDVMNFRAGGVGVGAGSTITRVTDYTSNGASLHRGTNNAAFSDNVTYTGNWFINQAGSDTSLLTGPLQLANLTASSAVATDASKNLVSVTNTGSGNNVLATSPVLTGSIQANGQLGIINAPTANNQFSIAGTSTLGQTVERAINIGLTASNSSTASLIGINFGLTSGAGITTTNVVSAVSSTPGVGAGGTITRFTGYRETGSAAHSATNNASFADNTTFTGNWFLNQSGTDPTTLGGVITLTNLAGAGSRAVNADASGNLSAASDSRLKKEDKDAPIPGLKEILRIKPRAYKWLSDIKVRGSKAATEVGFFANEVAPIIPSAAPMGADGYYGFYDRSVTAALVKALQEEHVEIEKLKSEFKEYKSAHH